MPVHEPVVREGLLIRGMHGLGDNIHQRGIVRVLMRQYNVWLETSWVSIYHDLIRDGLKVVRKTTPLRTQSKNAAREQNLFSPPPSPKDGRVGFRNIWYRSTDVNNQGSVVGAMCIAAKVDPKLVDFRLPVPSHWYGPVDKLIAFWGSSKPIMFYRPLVDRTEWGGCRARNPNLEAYARLYESVRDRFFVVSVADLVPRVEWLAGHPFTADAYLHKGELTFESLAALMSRSRVVFASPGFAIPLAQSLSVPNVCVFGGFERPTSFTFGAKFAPHLALGPKNPCGCWTHHHHCNKDMDMESCLGQLQEFIDAALADDTTRAA